MNQSKIHPINDDSLKIIEDFLEFFEKLKIDYWLGGGLFQCLTLNKDPNRNCGIHDIDFHVWIKDKKKIDSNRKLLITKDYKILQDLYRKTAFITNHGKRIEFPYLYSSERDKRIVYFLGHGKKNCPFMADQNIRKRIYHHEIPVEFFGKRKIKIGKLAVRVPEDGYLDFVYPFTKNKFPLN